MSNPTELPPASVVFGCAGPDLLAEEAAFFAEVRPFGFILFARNCQTPEQVAALTHDLRASIGRPDAPVLIDQEGGRVQRLKPPHWSDSPAADRFGALAVRDPDAAATACRLNARLIASELQAIGVDVDCLPCLDLNHAPGSPAIGSRAFSGDPATVAALGRAQVEGLCAGGVLPIMKHVPGHGRARVDSHLELPRIEAGLDDLRGSDFAPFRAMADLPLAMTGHLVITAVDPERPATQSPRVIGDLIRGEIGFGGILFSDDIGMHALSGGFAERSARALDAGCDIVLHCSGDMREMREVAGVCAPLRERPWTQWMAARKWGETARDTALFDVTEGRNELARMLAACDVT